VPSQLTTGKRAALTAAVRAPFSWASRRPAWSVLATCLLFPLGFYGALTCSFQPLPQSLESIHEVKERQQVRDRFGRPLSFNFSGEWNHSDIRALHEIPPSLQRAFIVAEDRRFFEHHGVDWRARAHAAWQNIRAGRVVRGASTITEQVVRMLHPRQRSLWSRVVEGFEAKQLEQRFSKAQILEFYLNQVPYANRRRGVTQAARHYWDRDLATLSPKEELALAVMVRAPGRLDLRRDSRAIDASIERLALQLESDGTLSEHVRELLLKEPLSLSDPHVTVPAPHFVRFVRAHSGTKDAALPIRSSLDPSIQTVVHEILTSRVCDLAAQMVTSGAALVINNTNAEVLAWVNATGCTKPSNIQSEFDAVITPRQPGSTLKPFLYALALSRGWSAATMIDDSPLVEPVGAGLHTYRNYSRTHYGALPLRDALGNSLNIPAIRTIQFTGKPEFLWFLRRAGFASLVKPAEFYGEGLALGNGEVTLFELTQAYTALASNGVLRNLRVTRDATASAAPLRLVTPEVASIISDILADPQARRLEFGGDGVLRFPVQTAVKTGTSTDYNDAWAIGYSRNFTVGIWMGNLERTPMHEISGARGPALVLRGIFSHLERLRESADLRLSPKLTRTSICPLSGLLARSDCPQREELFLPHSAPAGHCAGHIDHTHTGFAGSNPTSDSRIAIVLPSPGLHLAMDPRIPDSLEAFAFEVETDNSIDTLEWIVDDTVIATTKGSQRRFLWPLMRGPHTLKVRASFSDELDKVTSSPVPFFVR
jgi:penicillin-binding protein 1C